MPTSEFIIIALTTERNLHKLLEVAKANGFSLPKKPKPKSQEKDYIHISRSHNKQVKTLRRLRNDDVQTFTNFNAHIYDDEDLDYALSFLQDDDNVDPVIIKNIKNDIT